MSRKVRFKPERKRYPKKTGFVITFVVVLVCIAVFSMLSILKENNYDFKAALGGEKSSDEVVEEVNTQSEERRFLFWSKDSKTQALCFLWMVDAKVPAGEYSVYSPSIDDKVEFDGQYRTLAEIYTTYGESGLRSAVEIMCDIKLDSYIGSDTESFKQMINTLGSVTVKLSKPIEYRGNYNLILSSGKNTLKGDQLYKYLCYTNFISTGAADMRSEVIIKILENTINPDNVDRTEKFYANIANILITDISVVDYSASSQFIYDMFNAGVQEAKIITEPSGFGK